MTDLAFGLLLVALSIAAIWLPLSRPALAKWMARRAMVSEWLALGAVVGFALGVTFMISGAFAQP
ncbi:MAG TPA: hypothetical protein VN655_02335 [Pseudolabrys sp.]|jgi:hypothetical protein|nr:hypothetical protein [Pseudolabrys sp.]